MMSPLGTNRTCRCNRYMSATEGSADPAQTLAEV